MNEGMITTGLLRVAIAVLATLAHVGVAFSADDAFDPCRVLRVAISVLEKEHVTRRPLTTQFTREWISTFVGRLDPQRLYFRESDLDEFQESAEQLSDSARLGDFRFPQLVRERYRVRVAESLALAAALLPLDRNYAIDEACPRRFVGYATTPDDLRERWRLSIKAECLVEKMHGRRKEDVEFQLSSRFQRILRDVIGMSDERLCAIFIESLAATYDPNSTYLSPTGLESFNSSMSRTTYTLGLKLRRDCGRVMIESIHPSLRTLSNHELLVGWSLIAVRRVDGPIIDLVEMHDDDWVNIIHEPGGPLESDREIILELRDPVTWKRRSVAWARYESQQLGNR